MVRREGLLQKKSVINSVPPKPALLTSKVRCPNPAKEPHRLLSDFCFLLFSSGVLLLDVTALAPPPPPPSLKTSHSSLTISCWGCFVLDPFLHPPPPQSSIFEILEECMRDTAFVEMQSFILCKTNWFPIQLVKFLYCF